MKRFILVIFTIIGVILGADYLVYQKGVYLKQKKEQPLQVMAKTEGEQIYLLEASGDYRPWEVRGVEINSSLPGYYLTDFAVDEDTYFRWFEQIQEMGANTLRVANIMDEDFYNALYKFNTSRAKALYLLQGVGISDYANNNGEDAYSEQFYELLQQRALDAVDVVHGKKNILLGTGTGTGYYRKDVSEWVVGYVLATEWHADTVAYTNNRGYRTDYEGTYLYTTEEATAFEALLARVLDTTLNYESEKYREQRLVSFMNTPDTDPFRYVDTYAKQKGKHTNIDSERIKATAALQSGCFATYKVDGIMEEFYQYLTLQQQEALGIVAPIVTEEQVLGEVVAPVETAEQALGDAMAPVAPISYMEVLQAHHTMPVVVGVGYSSARGVEEGEPIDEVTQGLLLQADYQEVVDLGVAGMVITSWQDRWGQLTWNTSYAVDIDHATDWRDLQSANHGNGLLSFEPGEERVCYIDGEKSDWQQVPYLMETPEVRVALQYDEQAIYLWIEGALVGEGKPLYLPIDTLPDRGSTAANLAGLSFAKPSEFLLVLDGQEKSRLLVQRPYESLRANYAMEVWGIDAYVEVLPQDMPVFVPIYMATQSNDIIEETDSLAEITRKKWLNTWETGKLDYGNGNPQASDYDSLADFCFGDNSIEVRLPWQLLNFSDPSRMQIHDDYYLHYGVEGKEIQQLSIGIGVGGEAPIEMVDFTLSGWRGKVTYHERLKKSYEIMKEVWGSGNTRWQ